MSLFLHVHMIIGIWAVWAWDFLPSRIWCRAFMGGARRVVLQLGDGQWHCWGVRLWGFCSFMDGSWGFPLNKTNSPKSRLSRRSSRLRHSLHRWQIRQTISNASARKIGRVMLNLSKQFLQARHTEMIFEGQGAFSIRVKEGGYSIFITNINYIFSVIIFLQ